MSREWHGKFVCLLACFVAFLLSFWKEKEKEEFEFELNTFPLQVKCLNDNDNRSLGRSSSNTHIQIHWLAVDDEVSPRVLDMAFKRKKGRHDDQYAVAYLE